MNRLKGVMRSCLLTVAFLVVTSDGRAADAPVRLNTGPHLLLDDVLIETSKNLTRTLNRPRRDLAQPVVSGPEDKNWQPYFTVLRDEKTGQFRIWYDVPRGFGSALGTMTSKGGIHWDRPHRVLDEPRNLIFGASLLDDAARAGTKQRYKLAYWGGGMWIAHSADGLAWKLDRKRPVLTEGISDILCLTWDPLRGRYLAVTGMPSTRADGYKGQTPNAWEGFRRCVGQSTSKDAITWKKPHYIIKPDAEDQGVTEFYSIGGIVARGAMLIGLLKVLRDDLPCDPGGPAQGIGYTVLAWSRDGETWQRDRQPFLDRNPEKGSWDHAMAWGDWQLPVSDEVYLYYGGYARGHKVERTRERQIGLVRFGRDRYVARAAGDKEGTLRTRLLTFKAEALLANVDAGKGEVRVQITDAACQPIPGFSFADFQPITTDNVAAPARWKKSLFTLHDTPVRLEFRMRQARLFAFELR